MRLLAGLAGVGLAAAGCGQTVSAAAPAVEFESGVAAPLGETVLARVKDGTPEGSTAQFKAGVAMGDSGANPLFTGGIEVELSGAFDLDQPAAQAEAVFVSDQETDQSQGLGLLGEAGPMELLAVGDVLYVRGGPVRALTGGTGDSSWFTVSPDSLGLFDGVSESSDPAVALDELLSELKGTEATLENMGADQVLGIDATRYRATATIEGTDVDDGDDADAGDAHPGVTPVIDIWVGSDGLARRIELAGPEDESVQIWIEMFDHGDAATIEAPADSDIEADLADSLGFGFGLDG